MSIPSYARTNFQTLLRAAGDGNLALMECLDAVTGSPRYVICAVGRDDGDYVFTPFGHLADDHFSVGLDLFEEDGLGDHQFSTGGRSGQFGLRHERLLSSVNMEIVAKKYSVNS